MYSIILSCEKGFFQRYWWLLDSQLTQGPSAAEQVSLLLMMAMFGGECIGPIAGAGLLNVCVLQHLVGHVLFTFVRWNENLLQK